MRERAYRLMKQWCDTLLTYQVTTHSPYTNGALLCPACHVLHGRVADLCFPLTVLFAKTKNQKYLTEADRLIDWSEYNLRTEDGLWHNDVGNPWYATSAFSALSIGEALLHFGRDLPKDIAQKWRAIFLRMADVFKTLDTRPSFSPVTNYHCGMAAVLALAFRLTDDPLYLEKANLWYKSALTRLDRDGLLFGEGTTDVSEDGTHTVDMGYALEESIPALLRYAVLTGNHLEEMRTILKKHLDFLLPDGGIDNSFGTRHNKWTYWGSRTSDGLIEGLALVWDDPLFAEACERVLTLYENCTHDGLLCMPMAHEAGEPTCLHHTFAHAKALAYALCAEKEPSKERCQLPTERPFGAKTYQNGKLVLISRGAFRATFSACNATYLPEHTANYGGSLNLLYHRAYGIVCAATTAAYKPTEPFNQQYLRHADESPCMTAQMILGKEMGCTNKYVRLTVDGTTVTATANDWQAVYCFDDDALTISLTCQNGIYRLPIVCSAKSSLVLSEDKQTLLIDRALTLTADRPLEVDLQKRTFHQVGGLLYLPISLSVQGEATVKIQ